MQRDRDTELVLFDFGGVLAEEGFRQGLMAIARRNGLDPRTFFDAATEAVFDCGYVVGRCREADYWQVLRQRTGINDPDAALRAQILDRFVLRPAIFELVRRIRAAGRRVAILSDQTDWLDLLEERHRFFGEFETVFNSYHLGRSKRQQEIFPETAAALGLPPAALLFVDDNGGNIERAAGAGMAVHLYTEGNRLWADLRGRGIVG